MKTTTTINDYIQSELIKDGYNEFYNDGQLSFFDKEVSFIRKMIKYDSSVEKIVNNNLFINCKLENDDYDKIFKRMFVTKFLGREIAFQTIDLFASRLVFFFLSKQSYINSIFNDLDKYINNHNKTINKSDSKNTNNNRSLHATLPQDNINMNVDNTVLNYADENSISKNETVDNSNNTSENTSYDLEKLVSSSVLISEIFKEMDKELFLGIY